jgi:antirestriction protein ArdC
MKSSEAYEEITEKMVEALKAGTVPWRRPWTSAGLPRSLASGKPYRGVNVWVLGLTAMAENYASPHWGTFNRIAELCGMEKVARKTGKGSFWVSPDDTPRGIRKGEKSTVIYYWEHKVRPDPDFPDDRDKDIHAVFVKYDRVFNLDQADAVPEKYKMNTVPVEEIPDAQAVLDGYISRGPALIHGGSQAYYTSVDDTITLPARESFTGSPEYYSTAFHEAGHSTGHSKRLKRPGVEDFDHFGSDKYGKEELVAEMTSAMVCSATGIETTFDNSAAYIASWIKAIKGDVSLVTQAASAAQAAADLILVEDLP